ncbi:hypothetical protein AgCh_018529 [Apium graveolens]
MLPLLPTFFFFHLSPLLFFRFLPIQKSSIHTSYNIPSLLINNSKFFQLAPRNIFSLYCNRAVDNQELAKMESVITRDEALHLKETELRLGLPGSDESLENETISSSRNNKRAVPDSVEDRESVSNAKHETAPPAKAQVIGWPPIRSYRKNCFQSKKVEKDTGSYVKVSMDGAPYLRKVDLKVYNCYPELLEALENMFKLTIGKKIYIILLLINYLFCIPPMIR